MTQHEHEPLLLGGEAMHQRLADEANELVTVVLDRVVAELPAYASLPREELRGDITRVIERGIQTFVRMLRTGEPPPPRLLSALQDDILQRAEEGIPIDAVLSAHHIGVQVSWDLFSRDARPEDLAAVIAVSKIQLQYLRDVTAVVSAGYFQERQRIFGEEHAARQALLSALLTGTRIADAAAQAGVPLASSYVVLGLRVAAHPDEHQPGVDPAVAGRRKIRRLRTELERVAGGPVLTRLTPTGGIVVLPNQESDWNWLTGLVESVSGAAAVEITAGAAFAAADGVGPAAAIAKEVREIAYAAQYPPGVYRLDDVALEFQLSRPGPAREVLAALVEPLTRAPELLATLSVHLRCGLNRRRTGRELHVHPNTVDYRLRKIADLTGLDATSPDHLVRIRAALVAREALHRTPPLD